MSGIVSVLAIYLELKLTDVSTGASDARDSFFGNDQEATYSSDSLDVDAEDHNHRPLWHQPVRYVYDAAA